MQCLKLLIEHHGTELNSLDEHGYSALHYSVDDETGETTKTIIYYANSKYLDVNIEDRSSKNNESKISPSTTDNIYHGYTPLHRACAKGNINPLKILLKFRGIEINKPAQNNFIPLHLATIAGNSQIVAALLTCPMSNVNAQDNEGYTPAHHALALRKVKIFEMLLAYPYFDGAVTHNNGETIMHQILRAITYSLFAFMSKQAKHYDYERINNDITMAYHERLLRMFNEQNSMILKEEKSYTYKDACIILTGSAIYNNQYWTALEYLKLIEKEIRRELEQLQQEISVRKLARAINLMKSTNLNQQKQADKAVTLSAEIEEVTDNIKMLALILEKDRGYELLTSYGYTAKSLLKALQAKVTTTTTRTLAEQQTTANNQAHIDEQILLVTIKFYCESNYPNIFEAIVNLLENKNVHIDFDSSGNTRKKILDILSQNIKVLSSEKSSKEFVDNMIKLRSMIAGKPFVGKLSMFNMPDPLKNKTVWNNEKHQHISDSKPENDKTPPIAPVMNFTY